MEYIQACIYEVIRLSTDSQLSVRHAQQDFPLSNGKYIRSGNLVATSIGGSHALYPNPTKFDPERNMPPRDEHKSDPYRILPFGRGRHPCTGERYVKIQIKILLIQLYRLCRMEIMKESTHLEETINRKQLGGLSRPTKPVYVRISKRDG
jgi:sterol 14alpha-demethylase